MSEFDEGQKKGWYRAVKAVHFAGLVLFLGGIAASIVLGARHHLGELEAFRVRRAIAADLTAALIVPGMWLLLVSGAVLAWRGRWGLFPRSWLGVKQVLGLAILANGTFGLVPLVGRISGLLAQPLPDLAEATRLQHLEDGLGGLNLVMALVAFALAVWRPRRARRGSPEIASVLSAPISRA